MNYTNPMERRGTAYANSAGGGIGRRNEQGSGAAVSGGEDFVRNTLWITAVITLIALGLVALWLGPPRIVGPREEPWKDSFAAAEHARERGDRYRALEMYINAARLAGSVDDWRGQLTVACGLQKLGKTEGPSLYGFNVIVGAMGSAERRKSAEGMNAVADAFASLGASYASFARSQIRDDWAGEVAGGPQVVRRRTFADGEPQAAPGC
jgi:hypothetical protein